MIYLKGWQHKYIDEVATYDDHVRYVFYPERYAWTSATDTVWDWIVDDTHTNF